MTGGSTPESIFLPLCHLPTARSYQRGARNPHDSVCSAEADFGIRCRSKGTMQDMCLLVMFSGLKIALFLASTLCNETVRKILPQLMRRICLSDISSASSSADSAILVASCILRLRHSTEDLEAETSYRNVKESNVLGHFSRVEKLQFLSVAGLQGGDTPRIRKCRLMTVLCC